MQSEGVLVAMRVEERLAIDPVCRHSEYTLIELGSTLIPTIEQLRDWGYDHRPRLEEILREKD